MSYIKNNNSEQEKNLNEKDKRDIEFIINDIKSGKKLLNIVLDRIIELFLNGFVFVNEEKIKRLKGIEEDYIRRMKTSNKFLLKQGYVPIEKYNELLNSKVGVNLSYDDYISKEAIVNVLNKYAHEPIEESIVINFYKELQELLGE